MPNSTSTTRTSSPLGSGTFWFMAIVWNLCCWPLSYNLITNPDGDFTNSYLVHGISVVFGLIGLGFIGVALYRLLQFWRYGRSKLELTTNPGVLGGPFEARLKVPEKLHSSADHVDVELKCVEITWERGGDGDRDKQRKMLWNDVERIPTANWTRETTRSMIVPISMQIPYSCEETDTSGDRQIRWRLDASAVMPGVDFSIAFEVPVRETEESDPNRTEEQIVKEEAVPQPDAVDQLSFQRTAGGFRFARPVFQFPKLGVGLMVFGMTFLGSGYFMITRIDLLPARFFMGPIFGLVGLLVLLFGIFNLIHSMTVHVQPRRCRVSKSWFGIGSETEIPFDEIENVTIESRGNSGSDVMYGLDLHRRDAEPYELSAITARKPVVEFLLQEFQNHPGTNG